MTDLSPQAQAVLLLQQDDCAPDALDSFLANFPLHSGGLSLEEFKSKAYRKDIDNGFATYWYLGSLILSISADDPFYSLHKTSPPNCAARRAPMTDLSPEAQAVLDAFDIASGGHYDDEVWVPHIREQIAAALVAAAEHVVREPAQVIKGGRTYKQAWTAVVYYDIRNQLRAIAAELRGQDQQNPEEN